MSVFIDPPPPPAPPSPPPPPPAPTRSASTVEIPTGAVQVHESVPLILSYVKLPETVFTTAQTGVAEKLNGAVPVPFVE